MIQHKKALHSTLPIGHSANRVSLRCLEGIDIMEVWKPIPNFSRYEASNFGRLKSLSYRRSGIPRIMKPSPNEDGYLLTKLVNDDGNFKSIRAHRVVAIAFIPNPNGKPEINHINGIKTDNRPENLEWVTMQENMNHAVRTGLKAKGERIARAILTEVQVLEIKSKHKPYKYTRKMLCKEYGVSDNGIKEVLLRKTWKHI